MTLDSVDKVTNSAWALEDRNGYALPSPRPHQQNHLANGRSKEASSLWHLRTPLVFLVCNHLKSIILPLEDSRHLL